tara:strand:- start:3482 stop:4651 length:1170 start_codon:yes stop_codon:yes gene_type:complete
MWKKLIYIFGTLVLIILLFIFFFVGSMVDKSMNVCLHIDDADYKIRSDVKSFHNTLSIADLHSDLLLWDRSINKRGNSGHTDIPRLIEGNFALQVFDAVIKTPRGQNYDSNTGDTDNITSLAIANRWPVRTWTSLCERAIYQSAKLKKAAEQSNGQLQVITTKKELQSLLLARGENKELLGGLLSIEGLHALEGELSNLSRLYDAGYRMMGPVHFFDNKVGGSSAGAEQYGLTDFGREVIAEMEQKKIIIDLAHASPTLIDDILDITNRPLVVSHTGVKGTYESPRNLSDNHIKRIAERGGLIGIGFWDGAVGSPDIENIVKAIRYTIDLTSLDHVALGSDWDGGTTTYFDAAHISILTQALMDANFSNEEIRKVMGLNQLRFFLENLP